MKSKLVITAAIALLSVLMLSTASFPARAETNGASLELVAKGTVYDAYGAPLASDVWFSLRIMYKSYTMNLGNNSVGAALLYPMTTYGSGGTISNMSGPIGSISENSFHFMNVTQLYRFGANVSSITITVPSGGGPIADTDLPFVGGSLGSGIGPEPKLTGPNASSTNWVGLAGAVLLAMLLIVGTLAMGRKK